MDKMSNILNYPRQKQTVPLPNGSSFTISLYYISRQLGWFIDELVYEDFVLNGLRITCNPNILRQFKNIIPFGLAIVSSDGREPYLMPDFNTEQTKIFVLTAAEVEEYEEYLRG